MKNRQKIVEMNEKRRYLTCKNAHAAHKHTHPSHPNRSLSYVNLFCPQHSFHPSALAKTLIKRSSKSSRGRPCGLRPSSPRSAACRRGICLCCNPAFCVCVLFYTRPCVSSTYRSGTAYYRTTSCCNRRTVSASLSVVV